MRDFMMQRRYIGITALLSLAVSLSLACGNDDNSDDAASTAGGSGSSPSNSSGAGGTAASTTTLGASTTTGGSNASGSSTFTGTLDNFSFFVTSQAAMLQLANSPDGFGGDLRFGEADGLTGADKICATIAELSMPGASSKGWRAFLSVTAGVDGKPVNAIDRIGDGPWYDRLGRLVAPNKAALQNPRPTGGDSTIASDLPNENGVRNSTAEGEAVNNHDTLTGSDKQGTIGSYTRANTCNDWTSTEGTVGQPQIGHSWPRADGVNWISEHQAPGCAAGVSEIATSGGLCVGCAGGYGGIYCFALKP
jgi:hypothetical protein